MAHALMINGATHEVWLARCGTGYTLNIPGASIAVALRPHGEHVHELVTGDDVRRVYVAVRGDEIHVHLDGDTYTLRHIHSLERFAGESGDTGESLARAPMPGAVIAVYVEPGQKVQRGAPMMVIESMKMETAITAPYDGVVQAVHVALGQTFDRDALLVTLERQEGGA
jgi:biotin carboxyl carrier protein